MWAHEGFPLVLLFWKDLPGGANNKVILLPWAVPSEKRPSFTSEPHRRRYNDYIENNLLNKIINIFF